MFVVVFVVVLYPMRMRNWVLNVLMTFIINRPFPFTSKDISFLMPNFFSVQCSICCFTSCHWKEQFGKKIRKKERKKQVSLQQKEWQSSCGWMRPHQVQELSVSLLYSTVLPLYQEHKENILFALTFFFCNFTQGKKKC